MTMSHWTEADSSHAEEIWSAYQQCHDLSERTGQTAGVARVSGRIWFGEPIQDVIAQRGAAGINTPLFFVLVGWDTYYRKGGHCSSKAIVDRRSVEYSPC